MKYVPPQASDQGLKSQKPKIKIDCCQFKLITSATCHINRKLYTIYYTLDKST